MEHSDSAVPMVTYLTMETISSCCPDEGLQPQIAGQGGVQRIHHVDILNITNNTEYFCNVSQTRQCWDDISMCCSVGMWRCRLVRTSDGDLWHFCADPEPFEGHWVTKIAGSGSGSISQRCGCASGSAPKFHGSATLATTNKIERNHSRIARHFKLALFRSAPHICEKKERSGSGSPIQPKINTFC